MGMVAMQFAPLASHGHFCLFMVKVQCSMKLAVCFWRGSPCHPTFRSSAACPVLGMETFLTQCLGMSRQVIPWRQNNTYRCGLPLINEMIDEVVTE